MSKSPLWFAVPGIFVLAAVFIGSPLGTVAFTVLFVVSALYISSVGYWEARGDYTEQLSWLADKVQKLSHEQQSAMFLKYPEMRVFFGGNPDAPADLLFEDTGVDYAFFVEFMNKSNGGNTWPEGAVEGTPHEGRDARREKWRKIGVWLESNGYAKVFAGNRTYTWTSGSFDLLRKRYVFPYARLVGMAPARIPDVTHIPERTTLYQTETETL